MRLEYKLLKNSHLYSCFDFGQLWALFEASYTYGAGSLQDALYCVRASYFDYEAYARDLFIDDYYFTDGYVFRR